MIAYVLGYLSFVGFGSSLWDGYFWLLAGLVLSFVFKFDLSQTMFEHVILMLEISIDSLSCCQFAFELFDLIGEFLLLQEPHILFE